MAKLLTASVLFLISSGLVAENWKQNFPEAQAEARANKKPLYLDIYAEWCGFCRRLFQQEYPRSEFKESIKDFVAVRLDGEKNPELMQEYAVNGFPTIIIFDSQGEEIERIQGYRPASQIARIMRDVLRRSKKSAEIVAGLKNNPSSSRANYEAGLHYYEARQYQRAREHFMAAFHGDAGLSNQLKKSSLYNSAVVSMRLNDFSKAISLWNLYIGVYPDATDLAMARYFRGRSFRYTGQVDLARQDLAFASQNLPDDSDRMKARTELDSIEIP